MGIEITVAGGGIAGLAAALACARAGAQVRVFEQSAAFSEAGAGIQLGPNVMRILQAWSLGEGLRRCCAAPQALVVRDAAGGGELARMSLGAEFEQRYGAPYLTAHRADLHRLLLDAGAAAGARLHTGSGVQAVTEAEGRVHARLAGTGRVPADGLLVADGVWTLLRSCVTDDGPARPTGHLAYRSLAPQPALPPPLRSMGVTVWLAPRMHVVTYPVRAGEELNVVVLLESPGFPHAQGWHASGGGSDVRAAMQGMCGALRELAEAVPGWGLWSLHDRPPVAGPHELAKGRVALLGDAAHPMLPYLAQGAGMAIEDADALAAVLGGAAPEGVPDALQRYAQGRWRRCAGVQSRARRNATIFHARGVLRLARDAALAMAGPTLLDQPWLYGR